MRDKEKEGTHTIAGKGATADKQTNKIAFFCLAMGSGTIGPVVVGRYTQTRQRWLKAKIVKSSHGKYYKETLAVYRNNNNKHHDIENLKVRK